MQFPQSYPILCFVAVLHNLKAGLREAEVLELPPGATFKQRSSIVVLRGTLRATGNAAELPTADGGPRRSGGTQSGQRNFIEVFIGPLAPRVRIVRCH